MTGNPRRQAALLVIASGVCAALHVGKLPPALDLLRLEFGLGLGEAGLLLSMVQFAGMSVGLAVGSWIDGMGSARALRLGACLLSVASIAGAFADSPASLLLWRAAEGLGFLVTVLAAPSRIRQLARPSDVARMMGMWGAYMPLGVALGLMIGPSVLAVGGWAAWSAGVGVLTASVAVVVAVFVPDRERRQGEEDGLASTPASMDQAADSHRPGAAWKPMVHEQRGAESWLERLCETASHRGPWLAALAFAVYSSQWLAVVGFLPTIYAGLGMDPGTAGLLTAVVCLANMLGNVAGAALVHRGFRAPMLIAAGFVVMALASVAAYASIDGASLGLPSRYAAAVLFSLGGGLIPSSLFALAPRLAPSERTLGSTVGWMQQWSALGQFVGPPSVGWLAGEMQGWQDTWIVTGALSVAGVLIAALIARHPRVQADGS